MCYEDYLNLKQLQIDILETATPSQIQRFELGLYSLDAVLKESTKCTDCGSTCEMLCCPLHPRNHKTIQKPETETKRDLK
jgi:hypothetical protein